MTTTPPYAQLLAGLGTLLLQRESGSTFTICGESPEWFRTLAPESAAAGRALEPGEIFLFLQHFLESAEECWAAGGSNVLRSGIWSETSPDGREWHFEAVACTVEATGYLLIEHLTTGYEQLQRALQKGRELSLAHEQLVAEINKREILLHCIVHDMSAPLQGMVSSLEIARQDLRETNSKSLIELGLLAATKQRNLIQDLLDIFRSELSAPETILADPASAPDAGACAQEVLALLQPAFHIRKLQSAIRTPEGSGGLRVVAEKGKLERVFYNLVQNAMRYSPKGSTVTISLSKEEGFVRIAVEDEGPGVPPEVVPQLFQKFVRHGRSQGKAGLGLFFCRIAVEQWGGTIGCEPRAGGGTAFWFRLKSI